MSQPHFHVGLDIGSTTVKAVVLDDAEAIVFSDADQIGRASCRERV